MRVVLDANVFVSGAIQKGASFRIVQGWLAGGDFEVIMCPELYTGDINEWVMRTGSRPSTCPA